MALVYRIDKGIELTYAEMDNNLFELENRIKSPDLSRAGFIAYHNGSSTPVNVTGGSSWFALNNNGAGANSTDDYTISGVTTLWDTTNAELDFSELNVGDQFSVTITITVTAAAQQELNLRLRHSVGSGTEGSVVFDRIVFGTAATSQIERTFHGWIKNNNYKNNPAKIEAQSPDSTTVLMTDTVVRVLKRGGVAS